MTKKRNDDHSTEFGLWLREQPVIDSKLGYVTTNIDYLWENYKTGEWMLIEEKRYMAEPSYSQKKQFIKLYQCLKGLKNRKYRGFHFLQFEKTNPDDGKIYLNKKEITKEQLIEFLKFGNPLTNIPEHGQ